MRKLIAAIFLITALLLANAGVTHGQERLSAGSATFRKNSESDEPDYRAQNLKNFLEEFNSPLTDYADEFVASADKYGLDYRLVPAITGVESTFGKQIPENSYNAYGWANGAYSFESWEDSIDHVSMTLRTKYIDKGAPTIAKMARRYAPPSSTWAGKVRYFVGKIDKLPVSFDI